MSIFDLIGQAGAGYTRGLAQGEQAKLQLLRQQHGDQANAQYRKDQIDLGRARLEQDAKKALQEAQDRRRDLGIQAAQKVLDHFSDSQKRADHDAQAQAVGGESSYQIQEKAGEYLTKALAGKDPGEFPYPKILYRAVQEDNQKQAQGPTQGVAQGQNKYPPNAQTMVDVPGMDQYLAAHVPLVGDFQAANRAVNPNLFAPPDPNYTPKIAGLLNAEANGEPGGLAISSMPAHPEAPTIVAQSAKPAEPPPVYVGQPPKTAADIKLKGQQGEKARTGAAHDEAMTRKLDAETPLVNPLAKSLIDVRGAQAGNLRATTAATPQRVQNEKSKTAETARHDLQTEATARAANVIRNAEVDINRKNAESKGRDTDSLIAYRATQAKKINAELKRLEKSAPPAVKEELSKLKPYYVDTIRGLTGDEGQIARFEDLTGQPRGSMPRPKMTIANQGTTYNPPAAAASKPGRTPDQEKRYQELLKKQGK